MTPATGPGWELRLGRWQDALAGVSPQALIFDAPYGARTHGAATTRSDASDPAGLTPGYSALSEGDVRAFCTAWAARCAGWWVSLTDSELAPAWRAEMAAVDRYVFAPVPVVISGMSVRIQGDGPSSWCIWAVVSRPRSKTFATWGTLPGAYVGSAQPGASGGRGKPRWITDALVRDYTRPGDLVCDPFAGWGTTLASAVSYGRRAIGSECDPEAYREAVRRLKRPLQVDIFAGDQQPAESQS